MWLGPGGRRRRRPCSGDHTECTPPSPGDGWRRRARLDQVSSKLQGSSWYPGGQRDLLQYWNGFGARFDGVQERRAVRNPISEVEVSRSENRSYLPRPLDRFCCCVQAVQVVVRVQALLDRRCQLMKPVLEALGHSLDDAYGDER